MPSHTRQFDQRSGGGSGTSGEVTRFVQAEIDKWTPVVKSTGAKPE